MAKRIITGQMLDDLFVDAMSGDAEAEAEFRDLARLLAKRSNQQMLEQERKGLTGEGYRRAESYLGHNEKRDRSNRFLENNEKIDMETLKKQADEMLAFQSARDYSIPYLRESRKQIDKIRSALADAGVDIEDARVTFWMNELFKTGAWKEYKKAHGKSTNLITAAQDQFRAGKTVDDLLDAYNDYASGRDDAPDLVESWEEFAPGTW